MIPSDLYPTSTTATSNIRGISYTNEFTAHVGNLGLSDFPTGYYLGWIRPENISDCYKGTVAKLIGESESQQVEIPRPTYTSNAPIGYVATGGTGFSMWKKDAGSFNIYTSGTTKLINTFYPEDFGAFNTITLNIAVAVYDPVGEMPGGNYKYVNTHQPYRITINGYEEWLNFKKGLVTKTLNISNSGTGGSYNFYVDIKGTDFTTGTAYLYANDSSNWSVRAFIALGTISGFTFPGSNNGIVPMFKHTMNLNYSDSDENIVFENLRAFSGTYVISDIGTIEHNGSAILRLNQPSNGERNAMLVGCPQSNVVFTKEEVIDQLNYVNFRDGVVMVRHNSLNSKRLYLYHTIDEIDKAVGLFARVCKSTIQSYVEGVSFATIVNSNDEFEDDLKTGSIYDDAFRESLRDWQYVPLNDDPNDPDPGSIQNDFDPDTDMPEYDPTPPTPAGEEGHNPDNPDLSLGITEDVPGDSVETAEYRNTPINFPVSAFLTQYVLNAQDIFDMGNALWSGVGDPNSLMASNFVKTYTSTGTLNISNVMDFFVSVKIFPFNLLDFNVCVPKTAMTVGTGAVPLLNRSVWVLGVSTYIIDCGTVNTLQAGAFRLGASAYDFRNYINCTYTVFLPFCGNIELNPADVFPYELRCKYFVDFISGSCTGCVYVLRDNKEILVGSKTGQIGKIVPITASNVNAVVGAALSDVSHVIQTIGSAVISAATNKALGSTQMPINELSKNADYLRSMADYRAKQSEISAKGSAQQAAVGIASDAIGGLGNLMSRSGIGIPSLSGGTGLDSLHISKRPYLSIRRLNYCSPNQYAHTTGFAGTDGSSDKPLGNYQGWTVVENPDLSSIKATQEELSEIKYLLETGVYV